MAEIFTNYLRKLEAGVLEAHFEKYGLDKRAFLRRVTEVYPVPQSKIFKL